MCKQTSAQTQRLKVQRNARLVPRRRAALVLGRSSTKGSGRRRPRPLSFAVSERTVRQWRARFRAAGTKGLRDRPSRSNAQSSTDTPAQVAVVHALGRVRHVAINELLINQGTPHDHFDFPASEPFHISCTFHRSVLLCIRGQQLKTAAQLFLAHGQGMLEMSVPLHQRPLRPLGFCSKDYSNAYLCSSAF